MGLIHGEVPHPARHVLVGSTQAVQHPAPLELLGCEVGELVVAQLESPQTGMPLLEGEVAVECRREVVEAVPTPDTLEGTSGSSQARSVRRGLMVKWNCWTG